MSIFGTVIIVLGFIALYYVTSLQPQFHIQHLHIRENFSSSSNPNTSIVMDLKFKKPIGIRFDDLKITLYYAYNQSFSVIGYCIVPGFKQAYKITAHREAVVEAHGTAWQDALRRISQGSTVGLRAELITGYRGAGDSSMCISCTTVMAGAAELRLDSSGEVSRKPIRFR
ncbi:uncharacterized protein LOC125189759 [Salvia hispanica]|uniref:uncharacterized protein LOC125189759 n=1 Tax=Salvia hispanica TaxID=49212 RepID=UPI002009B387|nr:uncharacterized protein LOC125189759 [Salvia hispanica]